MIAFKILLLIGLMQLLLKTERPGLCAGIYAAIIFIFSLIVDVSFIDVIIGTAVSGVLAFIYFWLLDRFRDTFTFWIIFVVGLVLGVI
ncbi:hypothetical protein [Shewanella frigidimarina]|jgi:hypothetical protein|uniref:Uncharacterized protein n=1 Tax=Shewanella frigidimarina (strain NCIMB 400) TaxID=318167 RepID=Q080D4_SHEFN|nr:hypothetical protein [Shewanella frigidimarina]ABI72381.1 hypothetical protein Sfri_2539 [Shewanella frigidimarina NCIMB 400]